MSQATQKILVIPDLHGRTRWHRHATEFLQDNPSGTVLFLGDYEDSFHRSDAQMLEAFQLVLDFKRQHGEQVVLLLGNHDFCYLYYPQYQCSGFRAGLAPQLHQLYKEHQDWLQVAHQISVPDRHYLFVHAGVSEMWIEQHEALINAHAALADAATLADTLNAMLHTQRGRDALWQFSKENGGYGGIDGPLWVRPGQLAKGLLGGYVQVVGHTPVQHITWAVDGGQHTGCILTDCLRDSKDEFLTLEI